MVVTVIVKPGSRQGPRVEVTPDGALIVFVREPPAEGRATKAAGEQLARHFDVPRSHVTLVSGATSRHKRFRIS